MQPSLCSIHFYSGRSSVGVMMPSDITVDEVALHFFQLLDKYEPEDHEHLQDAGDGKDQIDVCQRDEQINSDGDGPDQGADSDK